MAITTVNEWVKKNNLRLRAVAQTAVQDMAKDVQTPRAKGGRLPVDTGFLRNSFSSALNSIPRGQSQQSPGFRATDFDMAPIAATLLRLRVGDRVTLGWTANYAPYMESRYGFLRLTVQNWQQYVNRAARKVAREYML